MRMNRRCFLQCLLVLGLLTNLYSAAAVEIIAHRGASADAPENTLAAFRLAWKQKVPAVELDVHLTKDNQLVVIHDADTQRTAGEKRIIKDALFDDLQDLDVGRWKADRWAGEKLVTLQQVLAEIPPNTRCFIEVKVGPEAVPALVKAIEQCGKPAAQLCIISFNAETIAEAKRKLPQLKAYYLASFQRDPQTNEWKPSVEELVTRAKSIHADGLDLSYKGPVDAEFVRRVKAAGLQFYVFTVDDLKIAQQFVAHGVDGITTNKPAWMQDQLSRASEAK